MERHIDIAKGLVYLSIENGRLIYTDSSGIWRNWSHTKQISSDKQENFGYLETPDPRR
jgi:hypothetical protein